MELQRLYANRFGEPERLRKNRLWRILCREFFSHYVAPGDCVVDIGAGHCEFINNITAARRIAVDLNDDTAAAATNGVEVIRTASTDLGAIPAGTADVVFVSNFFEHLPTKAALLATLAEIKRILAPGGRLLILQPNVRLIPGEYWDFLDHHLPLSDRTLVEALELTGLRPVEVRARFLPYTTKRRLPVYGWMLRLYLRTPPAQWLFGKQAFVVATHDPVSARSGDARAS